MTEEAGIKMKMQSSLEYKHTNDDEKAADRVSRKADASNVRGSFCRLPAVRSGVAQWLAEM